MSEPGYFERLDQIRWSWGHKLAIFRDDNGSGPIWTRGMRWSYETGWLLWRWRVYESRTGREIATGRALTLRNAVWAAERASGAA
jgi:hypothetical protein